nr:MAG TPA: hypothetical protein [Caudoviricetes sp.]
MQDLFIGTLGGLPQVMQIEADGDYTGTITTSNQAMDGAWGWDEVTNNTIVYSTGKWYGLVNWAGLYVDAQKYFDSSATERYVYLIKTASMGEMQSGKYTTTFTYTRYKVTNSAGNPVAKRIKKMYIGAPTIINVDKDIKFDENSEQRFTNKEIIILGHVNKSYAYPADSLDNFVLNKDDKTSFSAVLVWQNNSTILNKCCLFAGDFEHVYIVTNIRSKEQITTQNITRALDPSSDVKIIADGAMYDVVTGITPHKVIQGYIGDANNIARKFINTDGNYLYAIKVILSTGEPVPDVTITGISAVGGGTAVTNDKGYVLCSSTMSSASLSVNSPYMDALPIKNQVVNHDGSYICGVTLVLGVVTSGGHIIRVDGVYKFSSNVKKADFWGIGGGAGGSAYVRNNSSYSNGRGGVGGGSGYTSNVYNVDVTETDRFTVSLGKGGSGGYAAVTGWGASSDGYGSDGGQTTVLKNGTNILTANGGKAWSDTSTPDGGSGGGGFVTGNFINNGEGTNGGRNGSDGASRYQGETVKFYGKGQGSPTSPFEEISSTTVNVGYGGGGAGVYGANVGSSSGVEASYTSGDAYDGGATGKAMTLGGSGNDGKDGGGGGPLLVLRVTDTRPTWTLTGVGGKGGNGVVIARWGY